MGWLVNYCWNLDFVNASKRVHCQLHRLSLNNLKRNKIIFFFELIEKNQIHALTLAEKKKKIRKKKFEMWDEINLNQMTLTAKSFDLSFANPQR